MILLFWYQRIALPVETRGLSHSESYFTVTVVEAIQKESQPLSPQNPAAQNYLGKSDR